MLAAIEEFGMRVFRREGRALGLAGFFLLTGCQGSPSGSSASSELGKEPAPALSAHEIPRLAPVPAGKAEGETQPGPAPVASASAPPVPGSAAPAASAAMARDGRSKSRLELELIDPGKEPREKLRFRYEVGKVERVKLVNGTTMSVEVGEKKLATPRMPDVEILTALKVLSVDAGGVARRELTIERVSLASGVELEPSTRDELLKMLKTIENLTGRHRVDSRGRLTSMELDKSAVAGPQLAQLMDQLEQSFSQLGAAFPEEEVGEGARWTVNTEVVQQGMRLRQAANYELTELKGRKGRAKLKLTQLAPRGKVEPPGLPPGVKAELLGMSARGDGLIKFDLDRSVPEGQLRTKAKVKVRATSGAEKQDTEMNLDVKVRFVPEKG
jgi:hypothetical protein